MEQPSRAVQIRGLIFCAKTYFDSGSTSANLIQNCFVIAYGVYSACFYGPPAFIGPYSSTKSNTLTWCGGLKIHKMNLN